MKHIFRFFVVLIFSISCVHVQGAEAGDTQTPFSDLPAHVQNSLQPYLSRPGVGRTVGAVAWLGVPILLMVLAKRKLKRHHQARTIQLKEQQGMQGGFNPLMMMLMQQQGMGGMFPEAQVKGLMPNTGDEHEGASDPQKEISNLQRSITALENQKVTEQDILTPGKRRMWEAVSWISTFIAMFGGANFLQTAWAWIAAPRGKDVPASYMKAINEYREVLKGERKIKAQLAAAFQDPILAQKSLAIGLFYARATMLYDKYGLSETIAAGQDDAAAQEGRALEDHIFASMKARANTRLQKELARADQYNKNSFATGLFRALGLEVGARMAMSFSSNNKKDSK